MLPRHRQQFRAEILQPPFPCWLRNAKRCIIHRNLKSRNGDFVLWASRFYRKVRAQTFHLNIDISKFTFPSNSHFRISTFINLTLSQTERRTLMLALTEKRLGLCRSAIQAACSMERTVATSRESFFWRKSLENQTRARNWAHSKWKMLQHLWTEWLAIIPKTATSSKWLPIIWSMSQNKVRPNSFTFQFPMYSHLNTHVKRNVLCSMKNHHLYWEQN